VGDGSTFIWRRGNGRISGVVKPTSSFKDVSGRICRHIVLVLAAGPRTGKIEGIACRLSNGRWELDG
jgi:surface antigen